MNQAPLIVSYGAGVNSTAMLCGFAERGIVPDAILFADTGGEKPATYQFLDVMDKWLEDHGMPKLIRLKYKPSRASSRQWESIGEAAKQQCRLPGFDNTETPCGCYDGDDDD